MSTALDQTRQTIAQVLGEEDVRVVEPRWLQLMREGIVIQLHIRRWRARAKLTFADLGLPVKDKRERAAFADLLNLGEKRLLPARYIKALDSIDSGARKCLDRYSYATFWGRFVPCTAYTEWKEQNEIYRQRYFKIRDEIVEHHDRIVANLLDGYAVAARAAYRRLNALDPEAMTNGEYAAEDDFVDAFMDRIVALIPSRDHIRDSFAFEVELSYVPLPSLLAEDLAETERIKAEREMERLEEEMKRDSLWRNIRLEEEAARERQRMLAAMNRDVIEKARQQKEELIDTFLADLVKQLRGLVYEVTTNVLASIETNQGRLVGKASVQLSNLIEQVASLNFFGDQEIDRMIARVRMELARQPEDRDVKEIQAQLKNIATITRATLIGLGEQPRSARSLGVADAPTPEMVRTARRGLGLAEEIEMPEMELRGRRIGESQPEGG
jgi:hypothetical protein